MQTPLHRGRAPIWGIPRFRVPGPTWTNLDRKLHIKCLELKAVISALHLWVIASGPQGHDRYRQHYSSFSYQQQGGTHYPTLLCLIVDLFLWLQSQDIFFRARHIPGCLNIISDCLSWSNQPIMTEWSLHPQFLIQIFGTWETPTVDMFATVHKAQLPQFISLILEPQALAIDALSQDWQGQSVYMFPPFPLLNKVIQKPCATQDSEIILTASWKPTQPWFPHLLQLGVDHPHHSIPPRSTVTIGVLPGWQVILLHAWRLSCSTTEQQDFHKRSLGSHVHR